VLLKKLRKMKKLIVLLVGVLLFGTKYCDAQRKCGMQLVHQSLIAEDPSWKDKFDAQRNSLQAAAEYYLQYKATEEATRTTTSVSPIPVVFHIVVDSAQFNNLGGTAGIIKRCDSQIAVLNADFNRKNSDSVLIPSNWKPLYGNAGVRFALARIDPSGACTPGYDVKIIAGTSLTSVGFSNSSNSFQAAKTAGTGLPAWDVTKYYNVWCINFTGSSSGLLGLTLPKSSTTSSTINYEGVCILYNCLGSTGPSGTLAGTGAWPTPYNLGRTLTHETGHFFEIWHPWGDDGGQCPTWSSTATVGSTTCTSGVGSDDGLSDTPPESDATYGNPTYTITGGTLYDCCKMHGTTNTQPNGIACLSYMDYTDDNAMHLFTTMQAAAIASMVLVPSTGGAGATGFGMVGENYSLTQNPTLTVACPTTGIAPNPIELSASLSLYPNPTTGEVFLSLNSASETLNQIVVMDLMGNSVLKIDGQNKDYYSLDLSGMPKGIYVVKCNFVSGSVVRRVVLQ
jgi:Secretion system C-terminal sorting domain